MPNPTAKMLNTAEFLALPEQQSEARSLELLFHKVYETPKPTWEHNYLASALMAQIAQYARQHQLGKASTGCLVVLDEPAGVVVAPDVVYLSSDRVAQLQRGRVYGAPDLVVEVMSPSSEVHDRVRKMRLYHRYQVPWVWLIGLDSLHLEEYAWSERGYILTQAVTGEETFHPRLFPELSLVLNAL